MPDLQHSTDHRNGEVFEQNLSFLTVVWQGNREENSLGCT